MWTLLAWVAFGSLVWFGWSAFALLRAATKNRLNLLWLVGGWQAAAALGALLLWNSALGGGLSFWGIVGLALVAINALFWMLGNVRNRLIQHGVRMGSLLTLKDR